jgi:serine/threonine protein kinase
MKLLIPSRHIGWIQYLLHGAKDSADRMPSIIIMRALLLSFITLTLAVFLYSTPSQEDKVPIDIIHDTDTFKILGVLGEGGFGDVYRAEYLGKEVAIKVPNTDYENDGYAEEYEFLMILNGSSHIIPLIATIPSLKAIVLPIQQYGDLMVFIRARSREIRDRTLPVSVLLHIAIHLSIAVQQGKFILNLILL